MLHEPCSHTAPHPSSGVCSGWEPGDAELEEATLVVRLLAELAPGRHALQAAPALQVRAGRQQFCASWLLICVGVLGM